MKKINRAIMIELVIFDLDGLLADTEKLHLKAYLNAFKSLNYTKLTPEIYQEHWIRLGKGIEDYLKENKLNFDINLIRKLKAKEYDKLVRAEAEPMSGAIELLKNLQQNNMKVALATASYRKSAETVIETIRIKEYFHFIAAKEDIKRNKPFPDIFLFVAEQMRVKPENCVVLEDAEKGIIAAHRAGMKSIAVPNTHTIDNDFSKATKKVNSLKKVDYNFIINL